MGVCRHWRTVVLETPLLWQVVHVGKNTHWLELALVRSRGAVLDLHFHTYPTSIETLPMLTPHMHRVRKLLLPPMPLADLSLVSSMQPATFPVLKELRLWTDEFADQSAVDYVPFDLSPIRFPALRVLHLQTAVIPWTIATMSRLRYLHLHSCSPAGARPSFARFLDVLEECRVLEELELHHFISQFASPSPHDPTRTIHLPKLRTLLLEDGPDFIARFVANVYIQKTVSVDLLGCSEIIDDELQHGFRSLLPVDTSNLAVLQTLTEARITLNREGDQDIVGVTSTQSPLLALTLYTRIDHDTWFLYHARLLADFVSVFRDVSLQVLKLHYHHGDVPPDMSLIDLFAAFPTLRHVEINPGGDPVPVFGALSSGSRDTAGPQVLLLPNLKKLKMAYLEWSEEQHLSMITALQKRVESGLPRLEYLGLGYTCEEGACKLRRDSGPTALGNLSEYVTDFSCFSC